MNAPRRRRSQWANTCNAGSNPAALLYVTHHTKTTERNEADTIMTKRETLTFKPSYKYKMDKEELQNHLHAMRTGSAVHKDKSKYNRRDKYNKKTF